MSLCSYLIQNGNREIKKIGVYFLMLFAAAVLAGLYGVLHDQISYTFSSEYFTKFKFIQFNIPWAYEQPRLGAAYVGALATWWMGVLIFVLLGWLGFFFPTADQMAVSLVQAFIVVIIVALAVGVAGLVYGYFQVNEGTLEMYRKWIPLDVKEPIQFVRVGFMHNASYIGGAVGLLFGLLFLILKYIRLRRSL